MLRCCSLLVAALLCLPGMALAESQFYLIAKSGPAASLSQSGQGSEQVYLRWDLLEGSMPADITSLRLYRDGTLLQVFPTQGVRPVADINALYQGPAQQRRLLETVALLKEEAVRDDRRADFSGAEYASVIQQRLLSDPFWAMLASRNDFNIAMARYRAYRDQPGNGVFEYELRAVNAGGEERRVGLVQVNTAQPQRVLSARQFGQIFLSACDAPDMKDHYSVALNWNAPGGGNMADRVANQLFISGFDLYRSRQNLPGNTTAVPARDLAAEAAGLPHDGRGQILFADLEKINETLITVTPDDNLSTAEWLETQATLRQAGLRPGDLRAYYLVPRDFAGHFGPTSGALVRIPDLSRPPAPWNLDVWLNESSQPRRAELRFPQITLDSYMRAFGQGKRFCNTAEAETRGVLEFVGSNEDCATTPRRSVALKIDQYLLYRFDDADQANAFRDSDGDGFADADERPANAQCLAAESPGGARVNATFQTVTLPSGAQHVQVVDTTPGNDRGEVYWYRLATVANGGRLSFLSEPVRVLFPVRDLPAAPSVSVTQPELAVCGCEAEYSSEGAWQFADDVNRYGSFGLRCNGVQFPVSSKTLVSGNAGFCRADTFPQACAGGSRSIQYPADPEEGELACEAPLDASVDLCGSGTLTLKPVQCLQPAPAPEGVVHGPLNITVQSPPGTCSSLFQQVDGESTRVASSCGTATPESQTFVHERGEFCGYAVTHDANNNISATTQLGCRLIPAQPAQAAPSAPQPLTLTPIDDSMAIGWRVPAQRQSMVEVELTRVEPAGLAPLRENVPAVSLDGGGEQQLRLDVPPRTVAREQWCVRLRTYGVGTTVGEAPRSGWSAPLCSERLSPAAPLTQWLPWPQIPAVPQGEPLAAMDFSAVRTRQISPVSGALAIHLGVLAYTPDCSVQDTHVGVGNMTGEGDAYVASLQCFEGSWHAMQAAMQSRTGFIVYRQARAPDGQLSDVVQVSPRIDYVHWDDLGVFSKGRLFVLNDPYLWVYARDDAYQEVDLVFLDRNPPSPGHAYRYQVVYFDTHQRPLRWRATDWINAGDSELPVANNGVTP